MQDIDACLGAVNGPSRLTEDTRSFFWGEFADQTL